MEQQVIAIGTFWFVLLTMTPFAILAVAIWAQRRQPSLPEELYRDYVTKAALAELEARWERNRAELRQTLQLLFDKLDGLTRSLNAWASSNDRVVAQMEGRLNEHLRTHGKDAG